MNPDPPIASAVVDRQRRALALAPWLASVTAMAGGVACATAAGDAYPWERRLDGSAVVLLGEVHDNADGHRQRLAVLQRAIGRGWRPAIVMEQFDTDRQADIDAARAERHRDAARLIERAGGRGWDWGLYRPLVQLALDHHLPLLAANLPRAVTARLAREDNAAVLGAARVRELGLDVGLPDDWQAAQQREIDLGHCGVLPASMLPAMVRAQAARDAVIAELLARHHAGGVVLIAGNGHVRRDIGVPRWLRTRHRIGDDATLAVGFVEQVPPPGDRPYDAVVAIAPKADRADPCEALRRSRPSTPSAASEPR